MNSINNSLMKWERYAPVGINLEDMFHRLDDLVDSGTNYPPYNLVKLDNTSQQLQIALAGFSKDDIEVSVERKVLNVKVQKPDVAQIGTFVHKGIATRTFSRNWQLSEDTIVDEVKYEDGMLYITLKRIVPEEDQRKVLPIS